MPRKTKVVAYKYVKKHQIRKGENCGTNTIARCGIASGVDSPSFYLVKAKKIDTQTLKGNLSTKHGEPPGSKVIPNPNAYITDKVWNEMAPAFSKGFRYIPVANKYPDLWISITFYGFGSHLEGDAFEVFADHNILIVKEKGDT